MIVSYLTLKQFVEIHIDFRNNYHLDNIVGAAGVNEHIDTVKDHNKATEGANGHIEADAGAVGHIEAAAEAGGHIEAVAEAGGHIDAIEAIVGANEHIEAAVGAGGDIEDNDIPGIENKNVEYVEEYYHFR